MIFAQICFFKCSFESHNKLFFDNNVYTDVTLTRDIDI